MYRLLTIAILLVLIGAVTSYSQPSPQRATGDPTKPLLAEPLPLPGLHGTIEETSRVMLLILAGIVLAIYGVIAYATSDRRSNRPIQPVGPFPHGKGN